MSKNYFYVYLLLSPVFYAVVLLNPGTLKKLFEISYVVISGLFAHISENV